jgi:hypothetical protein
MSRLFSELPWCRKNSKSFSIRRFSDLRRHSEGRSRTADINDGRIRISVSIEGVYELIEDLDQALRVAVKTDTRIKVHPVDAYSYFEKLLSAFRLADSFIKSRYDVTGFYW